MRYCAALLFLLTSCGVGGVSTTQVSQPYGGVSGYEAQGSWVDRYSDAEMSVQLFGAYGNVTIRDGWTGQWGATWDSDDGVLSTPPYTFYYQEWDDTLVGGGYTWERR